MRGVRVGVEKVVKEKSEVMVFQGAWAIIGRFVPWLGVEN